MHFPSLLATTAVAAVASAHGDGPEGIPKLFGRNAIADLKARNIFASLPVQADHQHAPIKRQNVGGTDGQCGAGFGSCNAGYCCSAAGWCGVGTDYCMSPDCQFNYGPACDANASPAGTNTSSVTRDLKGSVEYGGAGIYDCVVNGQVALTYDDGPYIYTDGMLDVLKKYNAKATFFITGNNNGKGQIDNAAYGWDTVIKRMYSEGHQIASHTWSHQDLSAITSAQRKDQMVKNEMALRNILGFFPTYMRPPYSSCTAASGCEDDMKALGYHVTYFDLDTDDYDNTTPDKIQNAKDNFSKALAGKAAASNDFLAIAHDIHQQTAQNLTEYMLQTLQAAGYTAVTVGECLGDDEANWYRSSSGSVFTSATSAVPTATATSTTTSSAPTATATKISEDATCGGTTGLTCKGSTFVARLMSIAELAARPVPELADPPRVNLFRFIFFYFWECLVANIWCQPQGVYRWDLRGNRWFHLRSNHFLQTGHRIQHQSIDADKLDSDKLDSNCIVAHCFQQYRHDHYYSHRHV
ncbi:hypothetical protein SLS58_004216 [Diplodia intermedia]|uniref:Chitin deacetylase n=1 Tax=Diplodia intermedia TaxID=856260 RepID=A0ABR3TUC6_9PEZI